MGKTTAILEKYYKILLWIFPKLEKFPKSQKYLLTDRIEKTMLDVLGFLIEAVYTKDKLEILKKINLEIEKIRYFVRIAKDMKYMNLKSYAYISKLLVEIGKMTGGWIRSQST
ncbi:MAG: diversity-generating retroelement protein Avd [Candidatus Omnitrophica bacterium]|nr:diversity-generating retroelement protein Avd [Candidatus Omnitrophota bacterium]MDD5440778.1 diversity-generating retroelement protein Avd [Candidatus Omnitrophota bacterium]